jgi:hypothetical protein
MKGLISLSAVQTSIKGEEYVKEVFEAVKKRNQNELEFPLGY